MNRTFLKDATFRQQWISNKINIRHPGQLKKIKILGAVLELPAKQHCQFSPFGPFSEVNGLDWQCYLAGSSKTAPRILIFQTAMGADYSFYVKSIAIYAPAFLEYNNSVLARVGYVVKQSQKLVDVVYERPHSQYFCSFPINLSNVLATFNLFGRRESK